MEAMEAIAFICLIIMTLLFYKVPSTNNTNIECDELIIKTKLFDVIIEFYKDNGRYPAYCLVPSSYLKDPKWFPSCSLYYKRGTTYCMGMKIIEIADVDLNEVVLG